jgi:hypothetical protein
MALLGKLGKPANSTFRIAAKPAVRGTRPVDGPPSDGVYRPLCGGVFRPTQVPSLWRRNEEPPEDCEQDTQKDKGDPLGDWAVELYRRMSRIVWRVVDRGHRTDLVMSAVRSRRRIPAIRGDGSDLSRKAPAVNFEGHDVLASRPATIVHERTCSGSGLSRRDPGPTKETKSNPQNHNNHAYKNQDHSGGVSGGSIPVNVMKSEPPVHSAAKSPHRRLLLRNVEVFQNVRGGRIV